MSLFRRDPFFEDIFAPSLGTLLALNQVPNQGRHYFSETKDSVILTVDVPGVSAKDLQVKFEDNVLRVSGERKTAGSESKFVRSFSIDPNNVDVENINANLDSGVLTLTAPKRIKPSATKTIAITETPATGDQSTVTAIGK